DIFHLFRRNKWLRSRLRLAMTHRACFFVLSFALAGASLWPGTITGGAAEQKLRIFEGRGTVREIRPDGMSVVIAHEAISNYMAAMTMPFRVKSTNELAGLRRGDVVNFRLRVSDSESWIDDIRKIGSATNSPLTLTLSPGGGEGTPKTVNVLEGLSAYTFINEFGRPTNFRDYRGQAIALTFFFTRCPIPDYCPRLTKNFLAASKKLAMTANAQTNWHF